MSCRKKRCALLGMVFLMTAGIPMTSYAGGINGNEQSVVSVIHGQFEKDGVIYKVKQEYIDSAMSYLARDDVDLTADQAQQVIGEIYANVQTGVESGYLTAIGGTPVTEPAPQPQPEPETQPSPEPEAQVSDGQTGESGQPEEGEPTPEEMPETGEEVPVPEETTEAETEPEVVEVPAVISILELVDKAPPQSYTYLSRDTDALMEKLDFSYDVFLWLAAALAVVLVLTGAVAWGKNLLAHHRSHKFRKFLKAVMTVEITALTAVCLVLLSLGIGAWQDGAVLNKLADTGYYQTIYQELKGDTSISFALLDIPDEVMDHSITYERVVLAARQQVESDLSGGAYVADTSMLTRDLEKDITAYLEDSSVIMTDQAQRGLDLLMDRLDEKYANLLKWPFAPWWVKLSTDFWGTMKLLLPGMVVLLVLSQLLLVYLHHYKHRGVALCGKAILAGGILTGAAALAWMAVSKGWTLPIEPEYMKVFFELYMAGIWRTGLLLGGIGILVGAMYLLVVKAWKEGKK